MREGASSSWKQGFESNRAEPLIATSSQDVPVLAFRKYPVMAGLCENTFVGHRGCVRTSSAVSSERLLLDNGTAGMATGNQLIW